jgi:magnesium chelatase family protein
MLVAAINPCKCGYYPDRNKCNCTAREVSLHFGKISRPILDRIDMCIQAPKVQYEDMANVEISKDCSSANMRDVVLRVQEIQKSRFEKENFKYNSRIPINKMNKYCVMEDEARALMKTVYNQYDLTARAYHKLIRVARTIADVENHNRIMLTDIAEAVGYKMLEVK